MHKAFDPHAYALASTQGGDVATDGQILYRWTGTHWCPIQDDAGERDAYRWIVANDRGHASPANAQKAHRAVILWAPSLPAPTQDVVIPCRNGYVHLAAGALQLMPADRKLGLQHVLACDYNANSAPPVEFERFLEQVLPDPDVRARVQEYAGYTLMADARYQRAQLWLGGGANGKGVLVNIVQALHGNIAAVSLDALEGFRLSVLVGASLIYADEVPRAKINEQLLKSMIAGERVQIDRKYRDPISVFVRGKWLVLGNQLPAITDHSTGFWRRWDVVPFSVTIPEAERDPLLASRIIANELSGALCWALEGLLRLQERGMFSPVMPAAMAEVIYQAKADTNSVLAWHDDNEIVVGEDATTPKDDVYEHYRTWCEHNGLSTLAAPRFWARLRDIVTVTEQRKRQGQRQVRMCNVLLPGMKRARADGAADSTAPGQHRLKLV